MADPKADLPEGTDKIINGASETGGAAVEFFPEELSGTGDEGARGTQGKRRSGGSGGSGGSLIDRVRGEGGKLSTQAADKARGLVGQGLERSAEALANVGKLVGDTADGLDERLGPEYGDYARRAATAIEDAANNIAGKDADELIDDTREFVRKSPGVALAGAAIVGFAIARLIKSGLAKDEDERGGGSRES